MNRKKRMRAAHALTGRCSWCSRVAAKGRSYCAECLKKNRENQHRYKVSVRTLKVAP